MRDFLLGRRVEAVIFYHSAMGQIFSGADRTHSTTEELAVIMSEITGYRYAPEGVPGQITTGDAIDYLSTQGIAAIEIELTNHEDIEWERNLPGILAFLDWTPGLVPPIPLATFEGECIMYIVQPGDTLSGIAESYNVDLEILQRVNNIANPNSIQSGQSICIPIEVEGESNP